MRDLTEIVLVIDKSHSMDSIKHEARTGVNAFIKDQQKVPGDANLSILLFSSGPEYLKTLAWRTPIQKIEELRERDYIPEGSTCLHDAIGDAMTRLGKDLDALPESEKPNKVLFVIQTDGEENSSYKFDGKQVRDMIKHQKDVYSWETIYLGQHLGALAVADSLNVAHAAQFDATPVGAAMMYSALSRSTTNYRTTGNVSIGEEN